MLESLARAVRGALVFGLVGPPIGYLTFIIIMTFSDDDARWVGLVDPTIVIGVPFAYLLGGIPAVGTGVIAGLLRPCLLGWRDYLAIGGIGGLVAFGFALAFGGSPKWLDVGTFLMPGLVGGTVSARLLCMGQKHVTSDLPHSRD